MSVEIKIPQIEGAPPAWFDMQITLESVTYTLEFKWNKRLGAWFLHVLDEGATEVLIAGMRVVVNWPLNAYRSGNALPGLIVAYDTRQENTDPGLADLGRRVRLFYYTSTELNGG